MRKESLWVHCENCNEFKANEGTCAGNDAGACAEGVLARWYVSHYSGSYAYEPAEGGYRVEENYLDEEEFFALGNDLFPLVHTSKAKAEEVYEAIKKIFEDNPDVALAGRQGSKLKYREYDETPDCWYRGFRYYTEYVGDFFEVFVERERGLDWDIDGECVPAGERGSREHRYHGYC